MGVSGQRHTLAALPPGKPGTHCTGGWVGPRTGRERCGKSAPPTGIRSPDRPARSDSLSRPVVLLSTRSIFFSFMSYLDVYLTTLLIE
jgi:hypothetical protein